MQGSRWIFLSVLAAALGANWRGGAATGPGPGEVEACRMALGRAD